MKISAFNPAILTSHYEETIRLFEDLGFQRRHQKEGIQEELISGNVRMKDPSGFTVDVNAAPGLPQDLSLIRMNVDDFDEGYRFLLDHGFRNALGEGRFIEAPHLKGAHMVSPSGFAIMLMQHIKK